MKLNSYLTKDYENKPSLLIMAKQTQSNPIYGEQGRTTCRWGKLFRRVFFCRVPIGLGVFMVRKDLQVIDVN